MASRVTGKRNNNQNKSANKSVPLIQIVKPKEKQQYLKKKKNTHTSKAIKDRKKN